MGMMGPTGGGSKEFDATLTLLQVMEDPKKFKSKLKELSKAIADADKRKAESLEVIVKAEAAISEAVLEQEKLEKARVEFQTETASANDDLDQKMSLVGKTGQELNEFREELNTLKSELEKREKSLKDRAIAMNKKEAELQETEEKLASDLIEIQRKKSILDQL